MHESYAFITSVLPEYSPSTPCDICYEVGGGVNGATMEVPGIQKSRFLITITITQFTSQSLTSDQFDGYLLVVVIAGDHFPKSPLTQQRAEFQLEWIQLPLVTEHN